MDRALIHRLAAEAAAFWSGRCIERVLPRPGGGLALLPSDAAAPALDLAPVPPRSWLTATGIRLQAAAGPASPGQAALVRALSGRVLGAITLLAGERIARLELAAGSALMVELLGGAGNLFLVSPQGLVEITLRQVQRPGGALAVGSAWHPPVRPGAGEAATVAVWEAAGDESLPSAPGIAAAGSTAAMELLDAQAVASLQIRPDGPAPAPSIFEPAE